MMLLLGGWAKGTASALRITRGVARVARPEGTARGMGASAQAEDEWGMINISRRTSR
jgi:hypothetical protein